MNKTYAIEAWVFILLKYCYLGIERMRGKEKPATSIKSWLRHERPRELLLEKGPDLLSDAGLIALLLGSGTKGKDAVSLARDMIKRFGGLRGLLSAKKSDLEVIKGLGNAKIARLMERSN